MSSISDALKKAQQERDRLRGGDPAAVQGEKSAPPAEGPSLAAKVLRKAEAGSPGANLAGAGGPAGASAPMTPLADAIRQSPVAPPPAAKARREAAETIVEDYTAKHRLNLPAGMVVYHDRSGAVAEQYRKIRDALLAGNAKREPQVLVVTSAAAGEGKTTTVANLGLSLVEVRANRVLLVDGCLQRGQGSGRASLTRLLKLQQERGLAEWLAAPSESAATFIKATPWHRLHVLPAGMTAGTTELLKSDALRQCLRQLRAQFDWVLIDSPATNLPDAGLLGGLSDGMLLAVALHRTSQEKAQTALRRLKSLNLPVKSCILTRA